jgi:hypothetical protein
MDLLPGSDIEMAGPPELDPPPISYLRTRFLQIRSRTNKLKHALMGGCMTLGKKLANEKLSAVSPRDPLACNW